MADQADVRRIALSLPETSEVEGHFAFSVQNRDKQKGFVWVWMERVEPKKARVPRPDVVAIRVAHQFEKEILLASDEEKFFTEPHYNGFPAVLVRLAAIEADELEELIVNAWSCQAPRALVDALAASGRADPGTGSTFVGGTIGSSGLGVGATSNIPSRCGSKKSPTSPTRL